MRSWFTFPMHRPMPPYSVPCGDCIMHAAMHACVDQGERGPPHCAQLPLLATVGSVPRKAAPSKWRLSLAGPGDGSGRIINLLAELTYVGMDCLERDNALSLLENLEARRDLAFPSLHMHLEDTATLRGEGRGNRAICSRNLVPVMPACGPHRALHQSWHRVKLTQVGWVACSSPSEMAGP